MATRRLKYKLQIEVEAEGELDELCIPLIEYALMRRLLRNRFSVVTITSAALTRLASCKTNTETGDPDLHRALNGG
jgi:hypothetical protein